MTMIFKFRNVHKVHTKLWKNLMRREYFEKIKAFCLGHKVSDEASC